MNRSDINPTPAFFDRYINLVENIDLFEAFEKYTPENVYPDLEQLETLGDKVYAPGKWTIKDTIQHVIDNERIMGYRALRFSRNDKTELAGYDEAVLAAHTMVNKCTLQDLMEEFKVVRAGSIALFTNMDFTMLTRKGIANQSEITPLALGFVIAGHPIHHMNIIRERYLPLLGTI
ncbi:DinB family protein [Dyadobacter sandarakinus]|uniref:DinB family protein n=1 Tax=Dyadobacter sandarakinus TaxID=2747268 RepID=A0ABX7I0A1_9BACT|nr:DinB family protein [Dyadobacter sandarakinus]QRQ99425.1 DinB family protein [Dyadobacter sandarakinus]